MTTEPGMVIGDATLTASDIARLADVGRAAVSNWRRRYADFPAPVGGTAASPTFQARDVEEWLRRHGKLHQASTEAWAWQHLASVQPAAQIVDALAAAGAYLLAAATRPATGSGLRSPKQVRAALRTLDRDLATQVGAILPGAWGPEWTDLLHAVDQLGREQDPQTAFEALHRRLAPIAAATAGAASTPDPVARIILALAGPGTRILDASCGTGSILRMAADQAVQAGTPLHCFAQDRNAGYARIALIRLWFVHHTAQQQGVPAVPPVVHVGDSLLADAHPGLQADLVVANFPFGIHNWGHDQLSYDPRWTYGVPPRTEPELAWLQHGLAHLTPGGTFVALMPPAAASRPTGRRIRAELVRRGALRAVIALPAGLAPPTGIGLHLWVLTQPTGADTADRLLLVNAATGEHPPIDLAAAAWRDFRDGHHTDRPGLTRAVPAVELLDDRMDVTPHRQLPPPAALPTDPAATIAALGDLDQLLTTLRQTLPALRPAAPSAVRQPAPRAGLADLVRAGTITHLRVAAQRGPTAPAAADQVVLTGADVLAGGPPTGTTTHTAADEAPRVEPGDLLSAAGRDALVVRVAAEHQIGAALGPDVDLIRADPAVFDPWFLAGALEHAGRHPNGAAPRLDPRRLSIPVLPLRDQQRHGRAVRRLAEVRAGLERATTMATRLADEVNDGLNAATLTVAD